MPVSSTETRLTWPFSYHPTQCPVHAYARVQYSNTPRHKHTPMSSTKMRPCPVLKCARPGPVSAAGAMRSRPSRSSA
eukprot:1941702-Rhodomonas_salina.1